MGTFKGTVSVLSSDPQCKDGNARFTMVVQGCIEFNFFNLSPPHFFLSTLPSSNLFLILPFPVPSVVPYIPLYLSTFFIPSQPSSFPLNLSLSLSTFLFPSQSSSFPLKPSPSLPFPFPHPSLFFRCCP